jgi:NAD(P)-dependent dehydrogenase (short-subunit alcohol dehydrogenase family)
MTDIRSAYSGKVAIITGGASGIGAGLARELARAGAQVVLADRQVDLAEKVAAEIRSTGGRATVVEADVRNLASVVRAVEDTVTRLGFVDYFFNNAGIGVAGEMDSYQPADWDDVFDVNLRGVANGIQAVYGVMIRQGHGHIVNTGSIAGLIPSPTLGSYTATKHAVVGLSRALRLEAKRHGVRVSVLCPGYVRTPILTGGKYGRFNVPGVSPEKVLAMVEKMGPIEPDELARRALVAVARNEGLIVIPAWWKAILLVNRFAPSVFDRVLARTLESGRRQIAAAARARPEERPAPAVRRTTNPKNAPN